MRRAALSLAAAILGSIGEAGDASATATITLEWGACGGGTGGCAGVGSSSITVGPFGGQTLRLDIFLQHDEPTGLIAHTFSLNFDTDLQNELNLTPGMGPVEWAGTDTHPSPNVTDLYFPFVGLGGTVESSFGVAGRINSFFSGTVADTNLPRTGAAYTVGTFTATAPASYRVGQVFFTVTFGFARQDGADVFSGAFNAGFDLTVNGLNQIVTMNFGTASVSAPFAPEPDTVSLLGLGLLGLAVARRRDRRS